MNNQLKQELKWLRQRVTELEQAKNEWEQVEKALQEREEEYRLLFEQLSDALFLETPDGRILDVNESACQLLGYEYEELTKMTVENLVPPGQPAFLPSEIDEVTRAGRPMETVNKRRDGTLVPVELSGRIVEIAGQTRLLVSLRDITERKQIEEALAKIAAEQENIMGTISDGIYMLDMKGNLVNWNRAAEVVTGLSAEELTDKPIVELFAEEDRAAVAEAIRKGLEEGIGEVTGSFLREGRQPAIYQWSTVPLKGPQGKVIGLTGVGRDITERVRVEEALEESAQKVESLHEIARCLEACNTEDEVYRLTVEAAEKILNFSMCTLDLVKGDKLVVKATSSGLPLEASRESKLKEGGLAAKTYRTGKTYFFGCLDEVPEASPTQEDFKSGISAPIGDIGVFQVVSIKEDAFTEEDARLLELLLGHTAEALKRIHLQNKLKEQAIRGPMTGVYNRYYLNELLAQESARSKRYDRPIAFLMIDIDRFKEINDRFGHQMGDRVLRETAKLLEEQVRDSDIVVRYGGDEFLIILPETIDEIDVLKERIHKEAACHREVLKTLGFPITLSIGSAYWNPDDSNALKTILAEADRRMYKDKRQQEQENQLR